MQIPATQINAAGGAMTQLYDNIASGAIASWDVSGISQAYNHLQLVVLARCTQVGGEFINLRFNNDSAANYDQQRLTVSAAAVTGSESFGATGARIGAVPGTTATAGLVGQTEVFVPNYIGTTFAKSLLAKAFYAVNVTTTNLAIYQFGTTWKSTAAVNRITVYADAGSFIAGSRLTIYGLL